MSYAEGIAAPGAEPRTDAGAPVSTVPYRDGYFGLAGLCLGWIGVMALRPEPLFGAWIVLLSTVLPMLALELRRAPRPERRKQGLGLLAWVTGVVVATLPFLLFHVQGSEPSLWVVAWFVAAPAFLLRFAIEWVRNGALAGGFPAMLGRRLLARDWQSIAHLAAPARLWALKAIFIPLYGLSLLALVAMALAAKPAGPLDWLMLALIFAYTIDLAFGLAGYIFASTDLAPTMRSTQHRLVGWVVCLACYAPVYTHWPAFQAVVHSEIRWPSTLVADPIGIAVAAAMVTLLALYVSATVVFGLRFSNLSNRGVVAAGPYRLMKHPAYFAHVANAWIITLVLMPAAGIELGLVQWAVPFAFTFLYWARARTEEMHLNEDPEYVAYASWIARHGIVARMRRVVGF
ncbi:MAG TPA: isoprenylcysteine carboxylmethyltransferase family protein [Devosia sp.]